MWCFKGMNHRRQTFSTKRVQASLDLHHGCCPRKLGDIKTMQGFPGGAVVENLPANAGDTGSSPGLGRSHMLRSN